MDDRIEMEKKVVIVVARNQFGLGTGKSPEPAGWKACATEQAILDHL